MAKIQIKSENLTPFGGIFSIMELQSANGNLNHLVISRTLSKSNLAYQNEKRSCAFFRKCYYTLLDYSDSR